MSQIREWLQKHPYMVIVDEDLEKVGIVTAKDYLNYPHHCLIDCDFTKPIVSMDQTANDVFLLMKASDNHYLPVHVNHQLIGVISLISVTEYFMQQIR
ncbi:CBS domain-containing protein [Mucilaginibacter glaciei]|nr:CBS domain-containing protein [Mucilaginibacter glaciei]